jgi:hypothetical protein
VAATLLVGFGAAAAAVITSWELGVTFVKLIAISRSNSHRVAAWALAVWRRRSEPTTYSAMPSGPESTSGSRAAVIANRRHPERDR